MLATCRSSQRDLASKNILKAFRAHLYPVDATDGRPARECEIVATYTSIEPNEAGEGVMSTEYFDADGLGEFLLSRPKRANGILQRFVPPAGFYHSVCRVRWEKTHMVLEQRPNRHKIDDQRLPMMQRAVTFDGPEHLSTWHAVVSKSKLARDLRRTTGALIAHLGKLLPALWVP